KKILPKKLQQTSQRALTVQKKMAQRSLTVVASKFLGAFWKPLSSIKTSRNKRKSF
ncbi:hypothetical protein E3U43_021190, partial [Larimichthys crocea]